MDDEQNSKKSLSVRARHRSRLELTQSSPQQEQQKIQNPQPSKKLRARRSYPPEAEVTAQAEHADIDVKSIEHEFSDQEKETKLTDQDGTVLITGICGRLGKLLVRELHREIPVVGIDRRAFPDAPKDVIHYQLDVRRKKTKDVFRQHKIKAVIHLGVLHNPRTHHRMRHSWNVVAFQKLLDYMAQYQVPKLIVLSSANVYGPQPDNPQFLTEEAPLLGSQEFFAIRDLVELDMLTQSFFWKHPSIETVILRPCHILGRVHNAPSNYLRLEHPITILGFDPMVQVMHERDVVRAIRLALKPGIRGVFNLRGLGELPLSRIFEKMQKKTRALPMTLAKSMVEQMWKLRLSSFPAPELDHIRFICMVDDTRAQSVLGYQPAYSLEETLNAIFD